MHFPFIVTCIVINCKTVFSRVRPHILNIQCICISTYVSTIEEDVLATRSTSGELATIANGGGRGLFVREIGAQSSIC